ncbi:MAG: ABC transporter substrate-binding protein [bacterium]|nr:ABC transporter substrate-binding protein [bacterium]
MDLGIPEDFTEKLTRERSLLHFSKLEKLLRSFSPAERLLLYILSATLALSALALLSGVNNAVSVLQPARGGSYTEGIVEPPRFINPAIALSQSDEDLTQLVYSGLTRALPDFAVSDSPETIDSVIPDLAESYTISPDGTTYTFTLRKNAAFHDGTPLTSADVLFTIQTIQRPEIRSPRRADWEGVTVSAPDPRTVIFQLQRAYAPFLENTTVGILPKHLWSSVSAEEFPFNPLNTHPVGSGPYKVSEFQTDSTGAATSYALASFDKFTLGVPYLNKINFLFYPNEDALIKAFNAGKVMSLASVTPTGLSSINQDGSIVMHIPLPRVFGVFFNQGHAPVLADASVRAALSVAIDKNSIVNSVLNGYGVALSGPIPPGVLKNLQPLKSDAQLTAPDRALKARDILSKGGWTFDAKSGVWKKSAKGGSASGGKQVLSLSLATSDSPELSATANKIAEFWQAAGVVVNVKIYPLSELNTNIIRPRSYDAIFFGEVVGRSLDLFAFWHSSQRNDPGLNLAMYANSKTDTLLANARVETSRSDREDIYNSFSAIIAKDQPAVFLYSPEFIYIIPKTLNGIRLGALTAPSERFQNVYEWYTNTEHVWNLFAREDQI